MSQRGKALPEIRCQSPGPYDIWMGSLASDALHQNVSELTQERRVLLCITRDVFALYKNVIDLLREIDCAFIKVVVLDFDENSKTMQSVLAVCDHAREANLGRRDVMIALGGGVCSDIVRSAASLFRRGIDHICIPTTLVGQIDAAIGVKGGINFGGVKSALGTFHAPTAVFVDPGFLTTLSASAISDGLAEILKLAVTLDAELFDMIEQHGAELLADRFDCGNGVARWVIQRSINLTSAELKLDLNERGPLRRLLDFGHSFSPLMEARSGFEMSHGQAVAVDICLSSCIAVELGMIDAANADRIIAVAENMELPIDSTVLSGALMIEALAAAASHRGGEPNLVIPNAIGSAVFVRGMEKLPIDLLDAALTRLRSRHYRYSASASVAYMTA